MRKKPMQFSLLLVFLSVVMLAPPTAGLGDSVIVAR